MSLQIALAQCLSSKATVYFQYQLSWPKVNQPRQKDLQGKLKTRMSQKQFRKLPNTQDGLVEVVIENLNCRNPPHGFYNWQTYCDQACRLHWRSCRDYCWVGYRHKCESKGLLAGQEFLERRMVRLILFGCYSLSLCLCLCPCPPPPLSFS